MSKTAYLWQKLNNNSVKCNLCAFGCVIGENQTGRCSVRKNIGGELISLNYNMICAASIDPIEKKPLYHFLPGTKSYSIASPGCNFKCLFCQNWNISQSGCDILPNCRKVESQSIVRAAKESGCKSISYTYTEPTVFFETAADIAVKAKEEGLRNVFVSNGYMTAEAIDNAAEWLDAINVDLKAFTQSFYKEMTGANLQPVLNTLKHIKKDTDIWLEITTLLIPGSNDSDQEIKELAEFIVNELSPDTPWHVSAFFPVYKLKDADYTKIDDLLRACEIGRKAGLRYVYAGNIAASNHTKCPHCGKILIRRNGYTTAILSKSPICTQCKNTVSIVFD